jgi:hypothetical protein
MLDMTTGETTGITADQLMRALEYIDAEFADKLRAHPNYKRAIERLRRDVEGDANIARQERDMRLQAVDWPAEMALTDDEVAERWDGMS